MIRLNVGLIASLLFIQPVFAESGVTVYGGFGGYYCIVNGQQHRCPNKKEVSHVKCESTKAGTDCSINNSIVRAPVQGPQVSLPQGSGPNFLNKNQDNSGSVKVNKASGN